MKFLLHKLYYRKDKQAKTLVGFVVPEIKLYNRVVASTRIRVYDIINSFKNNPNYKLEIFNKKHKYNIVIFQKIFNEKAIILAKELKKYDTKIVLDINVNYYNNKSSIISEKQYQNIIDFTKLCDAVITPSNYIKTYIENLKFKLPIYLIEESINEKYFSIQKNDFSKIKTLIWSGFSYKAKEIILIKSVLENLRTKFNFKLTIIAEKNPLLKINNLQIDFIKYKEQKITQKLLKGDVFIAPRDLTEQYNLGHSFTKIGVAMAMGIPVIASPVPSYLKSPAINCYNNQQWFNELNLIFSKTPKELKKLSEEGIKYCYKNYNINTIQNKYISLFSNLLKNTINEN